MRTLATIAAVGAIAGLSVAGCGSTTATQTDTEPTASGTPLWEQVLAAAERQQAAAECRTAYGPLLSSLSRVDGELTVGMAQDEYESALDTVAVAYNAIDVETVFMQCTTRVGIPLEDAFNHYLDANDAWDDCIWDYGCDMDRDVDPLLQRHWSKANNLLDRARDGFDYIADPTSGSTV